MRLSDSSGGLEGQRHIGRSPHRSKYLGEEPIYVRLSGAEGEELTAALALCMGVFDPIQSPTPPIRSLYTKAIAQKAQEAHKVNQGVAWASLAVPDGVDVLAAEGDREMVLWRLSRHGVS